MRFVTSAEARKTLNLTSDTLRAYDRDGKIETIRNAGGRRLYNVSKFIKDNNLDCLKKNIIYCRVSSYDRKEDLERQEKKLKELYPEYEIIKDIGSGINFKRKGLQQIIELAISNQINNLVINHKDRLCRIGYELIEFILKKYSNTNIIIVENSGVCKTEEITKDLIEIITVYSSKIHGSRRNV